MTNEPDATSARATRTGLDEFRAVLASFKSISLYAVGGAALLPVVGSQLQLAPPWPPGIGPATSLVVLLTLIVAFQFLSSGSRRTTNVAILTSAGTLGASGLLYLVLMQRFVFVVPTDHARVVVGCGYTSDAKAVIASLHLSTEGDCPGRFESLLEAAQYNNYEIWTKNSILAVHLSLLVTWMISFAALASAMGSFITFQRRRTVRRRV